MSETSYDCLTYEQGKQLFDKASRAELGISGDEFLRRFDAGEFERLPCGCIADERMGRVEMLIPFVRQMP